MEFHVVHFCGLFTFSRDHHYRVLYFYVNEDAIKWRVLFKNEAERMIEATVKSMESS